MSSLQMLTKCQILGHGAVRHPVHIIVRACVVTANGKVGGVDIYDCVRVLYSVGLKQVHSAYDNNWISAKRLRKRYL